MKTEEELNDGKEDKRLVKRKDKITPQTKVVVRRLPAAMTEEVFLNKWFSPLPQNDYFRFVHGDKTLAPYNFCRAYINFTNPEEILSFRDRYDGIMIEENGQSSICVVEYAPFQKIGRRPRKKDDQKSDTILQDPDYKKFVESMEKVEEKEILDVEQYLDQLEAREKNNEIVETPLTNYLKQRREDKKRLREERRKMELERRKKRDEEKRKKKEAEKKKRIEASKAKKNEVASRNDYDGKKTLAETRPSTAGGKNADANDGEEGKVKILQKEQKDSGGRFTPKFQMGVFNSRDLEVLWSNNDPTVLSQQQQPQVSRVYSSKPKAEIIGVKKKPSKSAPINKSFQEKPREITRYKPLQSTTRDSAREWKGDSFEATNSKLHSKNDDAEPRFKSSKEFKRPHQRGYYRGSSSRTRGGGGGSNSQGDKETPPQKSAPQKYSEQRSSRGLGSSSSRKNFATSGGGGGGEW